MTKHAGFLRLLMAEPSSFEYGTLDMYDFQALAQFSSTVAEQDERSMQLFGRSLVSDAFFALRGHAPKDDEMAQSWSNAMGTPEFERLRSAFGSDYSTQATTVLALAGQVEKALQRHENMEQKSEQAGTATEEGEPIPFGAEQVEDAAENAEDANSVIHHLAASLEGAPPAVYEKALELSQLLDLRAFKDMLGFAHSVIGAASRDGKGGASEFTGYRLGGLSDRTMPMQMVKLAQGDPATMIALAEEALTYREYHSDKPQGKGPAVILRDKSGSMGFPTDAAHKRALSFEMALAAAFNADGRDLVSIPWSTSPHAPYVHGERGIEQHLRIAPSGGTQPIPALIAGVAAADRYVSGADILMLTDANFQNEVANFSSLVEQANAILQPFRENGGRAWLVLVGRNAKQVSRGEVDWADGWCAIDAINPGQSLGDLLGQMAHRPADAGEQVVID